jgi:peptidoglycan hydrolase-like protein with peptidoglycan-binding domain
MIRRSTLLVLAFFVLLGSTSWADELTKTVQKDLVALGYDPGSIQGDATLQTSAAISKFQTDNGLQATGAVTPQLAETLSAKVDQLRHGTTAATAANTVTPTSAPAPAPPAKEQKNDCTQTVANAANETGKKARAIGRLALSLHRLSGNGNSQAAQAAAEVADKTSAAADAASAAHDLTGGKGC